jgi:hypothetical protein
MIIKPRGTLNTPEGDAKTGNIPYNTIRGGKAKCLNEGVGAKGSRITCHFERV